jgi:hypothetical protein
MCIPPPLPLHPSSTNTTTHHQQKLPPLTHLHFELDLGLR